MIKRPLLLLGAALAVASATQASAGRLSPDLLDQSAGPTALRRSASSCVQRLQLGAGPRPVQESAGAASKQPLQARPGGGVRQRRHQAERRGAVARPVHLPQADARPDSRPGHAADRGRDLRELQGPDSQGPGALSAASAPTGVPVPPSGHRREKVAQAAGFKGQGCAHRAPRHRHRPQLAGIQGQDSQLRRVQRRRRQGKQSAARHRRARDPHGGPAGRQHGGRGSRTPG